MSFLRSATSKLPFGFSIRSTSQLSLCRPKKEKYVLQFKVRVINPDGSSYFTRYNKPLGVIRLPVDPNTLTKEQLKARLKKKSSERNVQIHEYEEKVAFDRQALTRLMRKQ